MKKITLIMTVFLFSVPLLSSSPADSHFISLHKGDRAVCPVDSTIGQTVRSNYSDANLIVSEIMKGPYTMDTAEKYLESSVKQIVVNIFVSKLQDMIPSDNYFMTAPHTNGDSSTSIRVLCSSKVLDIALLDGKVIAIDVTDSEKE